MTFLQLCCLVLLLHTASSSEQSSDEDECNLHKCQQNAFKQWAEEERTYYYSFDTFKKHRIDYFKSSNYRDRFCNTFYRDMSSCLKQQRCDPEQLEYKVHPECFSLNRRARQLGYTFLFAPVAQLEHIILRFFPDVYITPRYLEFLCTAPWLPTMPMTDWCAVSRPGMRNITVMHEIALTGKRKNDISFCDDMANRVKMVAKGIKMACQDLTVPHETLMQFYCPYFTIFLQLELYKRRVDCPPINCSEAVLAAFQFNHTASLFNFDGEGHDLVPNVTLDDLPANPYPEFAPEGSTPMQSDPFSYTRMDERYTCPGDSVVYMPYKVVDLTRQMEEKAHLGAHAADRPSIHVFIIAVLICALRI